MSRTPSPTDSGSAVGCSFRRQSGVAGNALVFILCALLSMAAQANPAGDTGQVQPAFAESAVPTSVPRRNDFAEFTFSPGDKLRIAVSGAGGEEFSGDYMVNLQTELDIPHLPPVSAAGLNSKTLEEKLTDALLHEQILRSGLFRVSVQVLEYAAVKVTVTGEVFEPGQVIINDSDNGTALSKELIPGDNPMDRFLTAAILEAGGVTPRADVHNVRVIRQGQGEIVVDLYGLFTGDQIQDIPLISGDRVVVPDTGRFEAELVRPTPITPREVSTYVSNVTQPRSGRTTLETSDRVVNVTQFFYGTRLAQAAIAAQCAGGIRSTNAGRKVLYVHTDASSGETYSIERPINALLTDTGHSPEEKRKIKGNVPEAELALLEFNPYLMPQDGIVCYDAAVTNISDFFLAVGSVLLPISIWQNIVDD